MFVSTSFASEVAELDAASMGAGSFRGADLEGADFRVALIGARGEALRRLQPRA